MDVAWGSAAVENTYGIDIAGIRGLDQGIEAQLVNGITTISLRGRYFSILPWALGEYFSADCDTGTTSFDTARFRGFIARLEFLVLSCTTLDSAAGDPGGAVGTEIFADKIKALGSGEAVPFPDGRSGGMVETYLGPCRAIGLIRNNDGSDAAPFILTDRGQRIWRTRNEALGETPWRALLWSTESLSRGDADALAPYFSLKGLNPDSPEANQLRNAFLEPWSPSGGAVTSVSEAYTRFKDTVDWIRTAKAPGTELRADTLLDGAWRNVATGKLVTTAETLWAEYEWRRRLHFAVELMLSAVTDTVIELGGATRTEIPAEWLEERDLPPMLTDAWPDVRRAADLSGAEAAETVPVHLYLDEGPPRGLRDLSPPARALGSFALAAALARQSAAARKNSQFPRRPGAGERFIRTIESARTSQFGAVLQDLAAIAADAHLTNTFRKMSAGQKCSLRFFPEGARLLPTGMHVSAGRSGTRLWNVLRILQDVGIPGISEAV